MFGEVLDISPGDKPNEAAVHFYVNTKVDGATRDYWGTYNESSKSFKITERGDIDDG